MLKYIVIAAIALSIGACTGLTIRPGNGGTGSVTVKPGAPVIQEQKGDGERGRVQTDGYETTVTPAP